MAIVPDDGMEQPEAKCTYKYTTNTHTQGEREREGGREREKEYMLIPPPGETGSDQRSKC
jgi:hypothetical protein